jgi:hypothetical protein
MKSTVRGEITIVIDLERGEWELKGQSYSVASVSFTVRKRAYGSWGVRLNHSDFKAYARRWTVRAHVAYLPEKKFPGFYPRREDLPGNVVNALYDAWEAYGALPVDLPPLDEGKWSES